MYQVGTHGPESRIRPGTRADYEYKYHTEYHIPGILLPCCTSTWSYHTCATYISKEYQLGTFVDFLRRKMAPLDSNRRSHRHRLSGTPRTYDLRPDFLSSGLPPPPRGASPSGTAPVHPEKVYSENKQQEHADATTVRTASTPSHGVNRIFGEVHT